MRPIDMLKAAALITLAISSIATVAADAITTSEMFKAPNDRTAAKYKYFDNKKNFIYCFDAFDVSADKFKDEQFCSRKTDGQDYVFFDTDKQIKNSNDLSVIIRYNTFDQGITDRTYKVAPGANGDKSVFIANPEDRLDVVNMLSRSKDVILFYKSDDSDQYDLMYYPMPTRGKDGRMPMVEAH